MKLFILGCRGVPAKHGGFETFAEQFALYMAGRNHDVTVACQGEPGTAEHSDLWRGIHRSFYPAPAGPVGTILFDFKSAWNASHEKDAIILTLGYNTAIFSLIHRLRGVTHFMNMDGIEWRRQKWSAAQRIWLRANEVMGARLANRLIADHPAIKTHLSTVVDAKKVTVIPYGADAIAAVPTNHLDTFGLSPGQYYLVVARPEPENSLLEIVEAQTTRHPLVVLGRYTPESNEYHAKVLAAARGKQVLFPGAIYDSEIVQQLRFHARAYLHGHQVGGTNPSLVESLAARNAIVAHRNVYSMWVAGPKARFFSSTAELTGILKELSENDSLLESMRQASQERHRLCFRTEQVMEAYEHLLEGAPVDVAQWNDLQDQASTTPNEVLSRA